MEKLSCMWSFKIHVHSIYRSWWMSGTDDDWGILHWCPASSSQDLSLVQCWSFSGWRWCLWRGAGSEKSKCTRTLRKFGLFVWVTSICGVDLPWPWILESKAIVYCYHWQENTCLQWIFVDKASQRNLLTFDHTSRCHSKSQSLSCRCVCVAIR